MSKNYEDITGNIQAGVAKLRKEIPEVIAGFSSLNKAATESGALDYKTRELIALALGVAAQCDGCIGFHTRALAKVGATRQEVTEALGMCVYMGGGPGLMYAAEAIQAFDEALSKLEAGDAD